MEIPTGQSNHLGGRTTISPPSNVVPSLIPYQVLASGVDKLVLAIDVQWLNSEFFKDLSEKKAAAKEENIDFPFTMLLIADKKTEWKTIIKPHGSSGYEWLLIGKDFTFRIGNWMKPSTRPSMMVEIHSETLWRIGFEKAVETIALLIKAYAGRIVCIKPSRVDLCIDMLMPSNEWNQSLLENIVTRAVHASIHLDLQRKKMQGLSIGKGVVSARIYDKDLEIQQQSKKVWMFDIWGLEKIPDGFNVIRVEFQLRREALKELGIDLIDNLLNLVHNLWAYCTESWLTFRDNPEKHHSLRFPLPWWKSVQEGFDQVQDASPLIRCKAFQMDEKQLFDQAYGLIRSMRALRLEQAKRPAGSNQTLLGAFLETREIASVYGKNDEDFNRDVESKRFKYQRLREKQNDIESLRSSLGHASNACFAEGTA